MRWNHNDKRRSSKQKGEDKYRDSDVKSKAFKTGSKHSKKQEEPTTPEENNSDSQFECSLEGGYFSRSFLSRTTSTSRHLRTPSTRGTGSRSTSCGRMESLRRSFSIRNNSSMDMSNINMSKLTRETSVKSPTTSTSGAGFSRSTSRRSTTPIIFSQSTTRRKPQPIEIKLECTLEELCFGATKNVKINKDVISDGIIVQEEDTLQVNIKPGYRKGMKITFEGKGDEKPGYLPADIVILIEEKRHPLFKRIDNDLVLGVQVPLLRALVGCNITVPLLGGEKMNLVFEDVIHQGCEKIIPNQGMPKEQWNDRGDLRLKFLVDFPKQLSDAQRSNICNILQDCFLLEDD